MVMEKVICEFCSKEFERSAAELKRNRKKGRKTYCSLKCSGKTEANRKHISALGLKYGRRGSEKDEFSPFRTHLRRSKRRKHDSTITLQDLKEQWDKQNGRCAYTNVKLEHVGDHNHQASLDRIDSSKGYIKGNIQWTSVTCNHAKNGMAHDGMVEFLNCVRGGRSHNQLCGCSYSL